MRRILLTFTLLALGLSACTRSAVNAPAWTPVAAADLALPTLPPIETFLPPTRAPGSPILTPTPNVPQVLPTFTPMPTPEGLVFETPTEGPVTYIVQAGDYPGSIAAQYGITLEELLTANNLTEADIIYPGQQLIIPGATASPASASQQIANTGAQASSDYFKIIPDSELVYGPLTSMLDVESYVQQKGGHLAYYTQDVDGETLTGAQIVERVAQNYSVSPRLLLAVLEYRSAWVTNPNPAPSTLDTPMGYIDNYRVGLYRQMAWTADRLNEGFYRWREGKVQSWTLIDGTEVQVQPGINPGTAGVQNLFAHLDGFDTWQIDTGKDGLFSTFSSMFGYPFDMAIEPFIPSNLAQPQLILPFVPGETWQFTGGPHGGWDTGSAWAALDFAPPGPPGGCAQTPFWVTAVADGLIVRTGGGQVIQDLDGDGLEQTGWVILYMHIDTNDRVPVGTYVHAGEKIGRPSCEGGVSSATHLHIARKYNGMWVDAGDPVIPFVMDGWTAVGGPNEYDGHLSRGADVIESWDGVNPINEISR